MNLVQRVQNILIRPRQEWPVIAGEPATIGGLFAGYLVILAAIPAVAGFVGLSLIGGGAFGVSFRVPVFAGLAQMVVGYVLTLVFAYVLALIVEALAPSFGGRKDRLAAMKVVAFSYTAALVAGVFSLLPMLSILTLLGALYSVYLVYLGLPAVMGSPPEKAAGYTAVVVVLGLVFGIITSVVTATLIGGSMLGAGTASVTIDSPAGEVSIDTRKMEDFARKMESIGKQMEAAANRGDPAAIGQAMQGAAGRAPIPAQSLRELLPEQLIGLQRGEVESTQNEAMGFAVSGAKARYGEGDREISVNVVDAGGMASVLNLAGWARLKSERQEGGRTERVYPQGQRTVRELSDRDTGDSEYAVILSNGVMVEFDGRGVDLAALKRAVESVPLARLEELGAAR